MRTSRRLSPSCGAMGSTAAFRAAEDGLCPMVHSEISEMIVSVLELLFGTFVVIGHNVFRIVPNEVPILAAIGLLSYRLRDGSWTAIGLARPSSWMRTIWIA